MADLAAFLAAKSAMGFHPAPFFLWLFCEKPIRIEENGLPTRIHVQC